MHLVSLEKVCPGGRHGWYLTNEGFRVKKPLGQFIDERANQQGYRQCIKCVMDTSDPDITFNESGVCSHCVLWVSQEEARRAEEHKLPQLIADIKKAGAGKKYDVLIGLSGGVDSSMVLHYAVKMGLRPLTFSIDNGWNKPETDESIMQLVEGLKVPFYRFTIDIEKFRGLQRAFLQAGLINAEAPTDHILMAATYQMAKENNIKYVLSGGNLATESIMPLAWSYHARDLRLLKSVYRKMTSKRLTGLPTISLFGYLTQRFITGITIINLLDYFGYNREKAKTFLVKEYGWKDYGEKHEESSFTKWFQDTYLHFFKIDKRKAHYSSLINSGQMTREEAIIQLRKRPAPTPVPPELSIAATDASGRPFQVEHSYKDFPNSEWAWNTLSKIYGALKKRN